MSIFKKKTYQIDTVNMRFELYNETTFYTAFKADLCMASELITIESPFLTVKRTADLMPYFIRAIKRGVNVRINTRDINAQKGRMYIEASNSITLLAAAGVKVHMYDNLIHRKLAIIDNDLVWEGSLNILSQSQSVEFMRRTASSTYCRHTIDFNDIYS